MSVLPVLIICCVLIAACFLMAFVWSVRTNQFDDKQGSAIRMLHDHEIGEKTPNQ